MWRLTFCAELSAADMSQKGLVMKPVTLMYAFGAAFGQSDFA